MQQCQAWFEGGCKFWKEECLLSALYFDWRQHEVCLCESGVTDSIEIFDSNIREGVANSLFSGVREVSDIDAYSVYQTIPSTDAYGYNHRQFRKNRSTPSYS
jgi:hypothetical protein